MERMETVEDAEEKLKLYRSQMDQVHQLLEYDPKNQDFLKLADDLEKVITLTETIRDQFHAQGKHAKKSSHQDDPHNNNSNSGKAYSLSDAEEEDDGRGGIGGRDREEEDQSQSSSSRNRPLQVGDHVEVSGGDYPFPAVITKVIHETEFQVKYYAYEAEVSLPLSSLTRLANPSMKPCDVYPGLKCYCKYSQDQQYYEVVVDSVTEHGYKVTYVQYGSSEDVPIEYLRPSSLSLAKISNNEKEGKDGKQERKIIPIPDKLQILPTDTEEEKARKKKKIKAIKSHNRVIEKEVEQEQTQGLHWLIGYNIS
eukprot:scaffold4302_cov183-Ochromonas_danica.AAC.2